MDEGLKYYIKLLAFAVVAFSSIMGTVFTSVVFHEISHKEDFKNIAKDYTICYWSDGNNAGYFDYTYEKKDKEINDKISKYTEYKAYSITTIITILFIISLIIIILCLENNLKQN